MTAEDLSSVYTHEIRSENGKTAEHVAKMKIYLFDNLLNQHLEKKRWLEDRNVVEWVQRVFPDSAVYQGIDELIWGTFFICVYKDPTTGKISSLTIDKLGISHFSPVDISSKSQYYPAIENLDPKHKDSNVRKCIAVSLLQKFAQMSKEHVRRLQHSGLKFDYDPTHAGDLASRCELVDFCTPENIGKSVLSLGFLQQRYVKSALLDVVYEHSEATTELNNRLVFHLGEQLEQLFNPLNEYSPEQTEYTYKPPENEENMEQEKVIIKAISNELLQLQTNFTLNLVEFLQKFLITLRVQVLNEEIEGLSTIKLNRLFSPTIDEVTRINCIFLDSLKSAAPYGSLEILKACSATIPYFYKAYTRHEAATKNFSKDIKLFLRKFNQIIPHKDVYTEMKIEAIIKGPQEKLLKIRLIIDRLYDTKEWSSNDQQEAKKYYDNIIGTIDSFGKLESALSSYSTRVFTPSGKILTELAKGWPVELQYKWLKRRVVGVYDIVDLNDMKKRKILVIFSDYIVFLDIVQAETYYDADCNNKPHLADILMNSLINEVPLPQKIPKLKVDHYSYIEEIFVSLLDEDSLRFDALRGSESFSIVCKVASASISASSIADLVVKAKILEKETAFHLFKAVKDDFIMYSTAHELEAYNSEKLKSRFALFLNMKPSIDVLHRNKLHLAIFAKFAEDLDDGDVQLDICTSDGGLHTINVSSQDIVSTIIRQLSLEIPVCYSSIYSPLLPVLLTINENLVKKIGCNFHHTSDDSHISKDSSKHSDQQKLEPFNPDHEKKKSFGTITTFRSHTSDLKDVIKEQKTSSDKAPRIKKMERRVVEKQPALEDNSAKVKKHGSTKKRNSIVDILKGIFGGKSSKRQGKDMPANSKKKVLVSKPIMNSKNPVRLPDKQHDNETEPDAAKSDKGDYEEQRMASVVRNTKFSSNSDEIIEELFVKTKKQIPIAALSAEDVRPDPMESQGSFNSIRLNFGRLSPVETLPTTEANVDSQSSTEFYKQSARQSQVFDKDLFGELIAETADVQGSTYSERDGDPISSGKVQVPEKPTSGANQENVDANQLLISQSDNKIEGDDEITDRIYLSAKGEPQLEHNSIPEENVTDEKKIKIFPSIPIVERPKMNFQRSDSFVELFRGMRIVLDESDAQYNWRRLSSELSLREKTLINREEPESHAFKSIARGGNDCSLEKYHYPIPQEALDEQKTTVDPADEKRTESNPPEKDTSRGVKVDAPKQSNLELENTAEPVLAEDENEISTQTKVVTGFKVIKASPTRIASKPIQRLETANQESNIAYDFSVSSDLNMETNKRWFELTLPSQEDFQGDAFYTPMEEPTLRFSDDVLEIADESSNSDFNDDTNETSRDTITSDMQQPKDKSDLLDDIEFSSFNMTFDRSSVNPEESQLASSPQDINTLTKATLPSLLPLQNEPFIYHLPRNIIATSNTISSSQSARDADDDPIWISPSKIDFYDLSRLTESVFKTTKEAIRSVGAEKNQKISHGSNEDMNSPRELSYAYLATLVNSNEESFRAEDKPVRLQFKG